MLRLFKKLRRCACYENDESGLKVGKKKCVCAGKGGGKERERKSRNKEST